MAFYRGKRVSEYRKQAHNYMTALSTEGSVKFEMTTGPSDRIRAIKNLRGLVTVYPTDTSGYNNFATGFICLFRCPTGDYPTGRLNIESSAVLHPVPFAMASTPLTIAYEFGGITAGQTEEVWFVVQSVIGGGPNAVVLSTLWAQKDTLTP